MPAIANALDGVRRAEAASAAGMARQALRDAMSRHNAEGWVALRDRRVWSRFATGRAKPRLRAVDNVAPARL